MCFMIAKIHSAAVVGLEALPVEVEVDIASSGLPSFAIVGLPDKTVEESKERVRSAIKNSGFNFPIKRITVNLAPSDIPKEGSSYDFPIALGILVASGQIASIDSSNIVVGELSLNGDLRRITGVLPLAVFAQKKKRILVIPFGNTKEIGLVTGLSVLPFSSLKGAVNHYVGIVKQELLLCEEVVLTVDEVYEFDMSEIRGQELAKRALEIVAAGGHNIIFSGPPGAGKTLLARTLPSILPELTFSEALEVSNIYSIGGFLNEESPYVRVRPFRAPHHSTSYVGLVGGGSKPKAGEISLAHRGVLFLDEIAEFSGQALESLRQPLEDGYIQVSRASGSIKFPARFILVAAYNPCPCGYYGDPKHVCTCSFSEIRRYQRKLSGPIMERIDISVEVPAVEVTKLTKSDFVSESSADVRARVKSARDIQSRRFKDKKIVTNSEMGNRDIKMYCKLSADGESLLRQAVERFSLSARSCFKLLKVSRTIADLEGCESIFPAHLAEALQYRWQKD